MNLNIKILDGFHKKDENAIPEDQIAPFLASVPAIIDRLSFATVLYTGVSMESLKQLRWSDVFFEGQYLKIFDGRMKRIRTAYGPSSLFAMLSAYKKGIQEDGIIFPWTDYILNQKLEQATTSYFGSPKSWHALRLSYLKVASRTQRIEVVAENMGVPPTQLLKYFTAKPEDIRREIDKLNPAEEKEKKK